MFPDETYLALVDRLGRRSTGVDLQGFEIDLGHFLRTTGCFASVRTRDVDPEAIDAEGVMLVTLARGLPGVDRAAMRAAIVQVWQAALIYRGNARHRFDDGEVLTFHYATWTPALGVVGRVECEVVRAAPRAIP